MIVTAGTTTSKWEEKYVMDALRHLGDPDLFNFYIKEFERRFAEYVGAKYAIATVNGTGALHTGLLALGVGKGDEVILPDMTYVTCANVIAYTGAKPVFVDINPLTWCVDPESVKRAITKRTKAIMPVWMYGNVPDMGRLLEVANGIPIIEDSCPAIGSYWKNKHAGTIGDVGCFSFQGAKLLAIGEGGMLVTNNKKIYDEAKKFVDMYVTKEFWHEKIGYMYEMNNVSAAVGLGQLEHLEELLAKKRLIFHWYEEELTSLYPMNFHLAGDIANRWMSSIVVPTRTYRKELREYLKKKNIDTRPFFYPISMFRMYKSRYKNPISHKIGLTGINLPSTVRLSEQEVRYVASVIKDFATHYAYYSR